MTWRRFTVLLGGLSPDSWWVRWLATQPHRKAPLSTADTYRALAKLGLG